MPKDNERKIDELKEWMREFCDERDWNQGIPLLDLLGANLP